MFNILSGTFLALFCHRLELDQPGEYYVDHGRGLLYFWPPSTITDGSALVSILNTIISTSSVSYVTFSSLFIEVCR